MSMVDQEEEDLKMALKLSMQDHESPDPKRSKPREDFGDLGEAPMPEESSELRNRRTQRELIAAAAEKRMAEMRSVEVTKNLDGKGLQDVDKGKCLNLEKGADNSGTSEMELSMGEANKLFLMIFGETVGRNVLARWSNQGIRFSNDPETLMGLVQHEGGPCGVLAAIQGFVLKYLLFSPEESNNTAPDDLLNVAPTMLPKNDSMGADIFSSLSDEKKSRALVRSMSEILFQCGSNETAAVAYLNISVSGFADGSADDVMAKALEGVSIESGPDLQKVVRIHTCTSRSSLICKLEELLPVYQSRLGALLFLISALLSRGLDAVQEDRDDPTQPLVTAPFGHASQEIVNLLLSGRAVGNVFDGRIDLGGGMFINGISTPVEIGFLTLLESLNYCKVGQHLKRPKLPIWVVGSESHYTILFTPDARIQDESELDRRESEIRRAFDARDGSGGGGFVSAEGFRKVVEESGVRLPPERVERLCGSDFVVWSEFWEAVVELDESFAGGSTRERVFELYHFNGIAKSFAGGGGRRGDEVGPVQRPMLVRVRVSVPPRWPLEEFTVEDLSVIDNSTRMGRTVGRNGPLVDCIRTRWPGAVCSWEGGEPSIV